MYQFTTPQAEMIVYWAVTDLCPEHASHCGITGRTGRRALHTETWMEWAVVG